MAVNSSEEFFWILRKDMENQLVFGVVRILLVDPYNARIVKMCDRIHHWKFLQTRSQLVKDKHTGICIFSMLSMSLRMRPEDARYQCQNAHNVVVLTDEGTSNLQCEPPSNISYLEVPISMKNKTCLNSVPDLHNHTNLEVDKVNNHAPCALDVDIEKGKGELLKFSDECVANLKSDDSLARTLQREICLQGGGKFMQLLMNHGTELPKFTSRERAYDMSSNRSRKYKRSPSFNSRRVVLLFSVLSSMGTMILIYLTLRVRQMGDGSGNV